MPVISKEAWRDHRCREYTGALDGDGYGKGRQHRREWVKINGPIPFGVCVLHHCDNRACVEINHLFLGSNADNVADRESKGRGVRAGFCTMKQANHPRAKLTETQISEILQELSNRSTPYGQSDLAEKYGVHHKTIARVWRRRDNGGY